MPNPSRHDVAASLAAVLHEVLREGRAVDVPGLGRFARWHEPAHVVQRHSDAKTLLVPPRDVVRLVNDDRDGDGA